LSIRTSTTYSPYQDFAVRVTYTSKYSQKSEADRTKIEYFIVRLTPSETCIWDKLTKTAEIPYWLYSVTSSSTAVFKSPSFSRDIAGCLLTQKLFFYDDATRAWQDFSVAAVATAHPFVTFTSGLNTGNADIGKITVSATKASISSTYWKPFKTYKAKITLEDTKSNG